MHRLIHLLLAPILVIALAAGAAGCGGGSSTSGGSGSTSTPLQLEEESSGSGVSQFSATTSGGQELLAFGTEASAAEREAASKVLEENLEARAAADFVKQCATLKAILVQELIEQLTKEKVSNPSCDKALNRFAQPLSGSSKLRADQLDGHITVLLQEGSTGYALFHGNDQKDYVMPLTKEEGQWKVASLLAALVQ
jgi:hypothetical protein